MAGPQRRKRAGFRAARSRMRPVRQAAANARPLGDGRLRTAWQSGDPQAQVREPWNKWGLTPSRPRFWPMSAKLMPLAPKNSPHHEAALRQASRRWALAGVAGMTFAVAVAFSGVFRHMPPPLAAT